MTGSLQQKQIGFALRMFGQTYMVGPSPSGINLQMLRAFHQPEPNTKNSFTVDREEQGLRLHYGFQILQISFKERASK
jgi:hypothetical protein